MRDKKREAVEGRRRRQLSRSKRSDNPQVWVDRLAYENQGEIICPECGRLFDVFDDCWCPQCVL